MNETLGLSIILEDIEAAVATSYLAPSGKGAWALAKGPGTTLYVGTFYDGKLLLFDLEKRIYYSTISTGEEYLWNFCEDANHRLYSGTYPNGKLIRFDPLEQRITEYPNPTQNNQYLRFVSLLPGGDRLLCRFLSGTPVSLVFNTNSEKFEEPLDLAPVTEGALVGDHFFSRTSCYDQSLRQVKIENTPYSYLSNNFEAELRLCAQNRLAVKDKGFLKIFETPSGTELFSFPLSRIPLGVSFLGMHGSKCAVGIQGQHYILVEPGSSNDIKRRSPAVESPPRTILFLKKDVAGQRIWGGPPMGQTLFNYNYNNKATQNLDTLSNTGGQVCDMVFLHGLAYAASYAGGELLQIDPNKAVDLQAGNNPKRMLVMEGRGYIRPGGICADKDELIYACWMAGYGRYGGALTVTSSKTLKSTVLENPFGEVALSGIFVDNQRIYCGTSTAGNGLPPQKSTPKLGILSKGSLKMEREFPYPGGDVRFLVMSEPQQILLFNVGSRIEGLDTKSLKPKQFPSTPPCTSAGGDVSASGHYYFGSGKSIFCLDPVTGKFDLVARLSRDITAIQIVGDSDLYCSCKSELHHISIPQKHLKIRTGI